MEKDSTIKLKNLVIKQSLKEGENPSQKHLRIAGETINAFSKAENSSLVYSAACFAPAFAIFSQINTVSDSTCLCFKIITFLTMIIFGLSGLYFGLYRTFVLAKRRMSVEAFVMGLKYEYEFTATPTGAWYILNRFIVRFFVPLGFVLLACVATYLMFGS